MGAKKQKARYEFRTLVKIVSLLSAGRERDFRRIILGLAEAHVHRLTRGVAPFGLSRQQFDTPG